MSNAALSEIYFIAGMMVIILIISFVATYIFFKTYYKEKTEHEQLRKKEKEARELRAKISG